MQYYPPNAELVFTLDVAPADGTEVNVRTSDGPPPSRELTQMPIEAGEL